MNRKSRSISRRSSILKIDVNREDETTTFGARNKRTSRRVSFAETYQVKEFPRDSPRLFKDSPILSDQENDVDNTESTSKNQGLTGLDKLLTGVIQTPYQNVAGYPMPEMSSESLALFDINTTILDNVDMDTSEVGENLDDLYPEMDFQSEPSKELKFDASSFVQSLKSNSSEGLKAVQIYSPCRDSNKTKPEQPFMFHNFSHHDKENIRLPIGVVNPSSNTKQAEINNYFDLEDVTMGMEETNCIGAIASEVKGQCKDNKNSPVLSLQTKSNHPDKKNILSGFKKDTEGFSTKSESALTTKSIIQRLFSKPQYEKEDTDHEDMEEATCILDTIKQDKPGKLTVVSTSSTNKQAEVTKYFNSEDVTTGMEETKCVGGISTQITEKSKDNSPVLSLQAKINQDSKWNENEVTKYFDSEDITEGIEETNCVGGIVDQGRLAGNWTVSMNESKIANDITLKTSSSVRKGLKIRDNIKCDIRVDGNVSNKSLNQAVDAEIEIEETKCVGGIMKSSNWPVSSLDLHQEVNTAENKIGVIGENLTVSVPFSMEETECYTSKIKVGGGDFSITANKLAATTDTIEDIEMTKNIPVPMEETKSLGKILDKTCLKSKEIETIKDENKTVMDVSNMEETRVVGGMLNQANKSSVEQVFSKTLSNATVDYTVAMEETKPVGKILEKTVNANKTVDYTLAMEETKPVGKILEKIVNANKTVDYSVAMEETKAVGKILEKTVNANKTVDYSVAMEETKAVGKILEKTVNANKTVDYSVAMEETKPVGKILEKTVNANKTVDYTVAMEETKPVGKILEKTVNANKTVDYTVAMEETKPVGKILEKTVNTNKTIDYTVAMEETKSVGKILEKTVNSNKTVDYTVAMEETKPVGKILEKTFSANKTVDYTVAMEETKPVGKILEKTVNANKTVDYSAEMEETKSVGKILEKTVNANKTVDYSVAMEETKPEGKIQEKNVNTNKTVDYSVAMEETKAVGKILEKTVNANKTVDYSVAMEETKAVGKILEKTVNANKTVDYSVAMEETKPVGKILEKTVNDITAKGFNTTSSINNTIKLTVPMEETAALGGIMNKTTDKTMYFDDVPTDWSAQNLQLKATGKSADRTVVDNVNITSKIEETKCVGGILDEDIEKKTEIEVKNAGMRLKTEDMTIDVTVEMEETKCETVALEVGDSLRVSKDSKARQLNAISNRTTLKPFDMEKTICAQRSLESPNTVTAGEKVNIKDSYVKRKSVDDEKTFKLSTKRNFDDHKNYGTPEIGEEMTRDFTQTQTKLARLKELLIQSSRKTAKHLRSGDIKTPSKAAINASFHLSSERSPFHKRLRMSTEQPAYEDMKHSGDVFRTDLECMTLDCSDLSGIEDEQMPETMHIDLCATGSSNETHSDKNSTVSTESEHTTNQDANETSKSGNETQSSAINISLESNDTRGSGNESRSSGYNVSMFSNKSFAVSSFVAPKGPLKLESFFKLTFNLVSTVQGLRCSTIFAKSVDTDDPVELLQAELTLPSIVKAKRNLQQRITEETNRCAGEMEWVEKMLEETQPEIFQQCATASDVELEEITSQLRSLLKACHKEVEIVWKQETTKMFSQMLSDIQEHGKKEAEERLRKAKANNKTLDDLSASLDNELEELERKEQQLLDLQKKEENLHREVEEVSTLLRSKRAEEEQLRQELNLRSQSHDIEKERNALIRQIEAHFVCVEWNLEDWREDYAEFTFLDDLLELRIQFKAGPTEKHLSHIAWKILKDCKLFQEKVAVSFVQKGIDIDQLMQKYPTFSSLRKLLHEVSCCVNEIRRFCVDVEDVYQQNVLIFKDNSISLEIWDRQTLDLIVATFIFDSSHPLTNQAQASVVVRYGRLKSSQIEERLCAVTPGPKYLSRLIQSINFKQLHKDIKK